MPVDADKDGSLARSAVKEHLANFRMPDFMSEFKCRDDALPYDPTFTSASFSPYNYLDDIPGDVAVYTVSGWMDGAGYANGSLSRFLTLPIRNAAYCWDRGTTAPGSTPRRGGPGRSPSFRYWAKCCASSISISQEKRPVSPTRIRSTTSPSMPRNGARPKAGRR